MAVVMRGTLKFAAADEGNKLVVYDAPVPQERRSGEFINNGQIRSDRYIEDQYELEIVFCDGAFPTVKEIGGKVADIAKERKKELADLHVNPGGKDCCLCVPPDARAFMKRDDASGKFVPEIVVPFFYRLSCEGKGIPLPSWGDHKHGLEGLLECYQQSHGKLPDGDFHAFLRDLRAYGVDGLLKFYQKSGSELSDGDFSDFFRTVEECVRVGKGLLYEILSGRKKYSPDRMKSRIKHWQGATLGQIALRKKNTPTK